MGVVVPRVKGRSLSLSSMGPLRAWEHRQKATPPIHSHTYTFPLLESPPLAASLPPGLSPALPSELGHLSAMPIRAAGVGGWMGQGALAWGCWDRESCC